LKTIFFQIVCLKTAIFQILRLETAKFQSQRTLKALAHLDWLRANSKA
jgi:hypothetical protein